MKTSLILVFLFFAAGNTYAQEISERICQSYINTYCLRCHTAERICDSIGVKTPFDWKETIKIMGEYGNLDKGILDKVHACVSSEEAQGFNLCDGKVSSLGAAPMAMTVSTMTVAEEPPQKDEKVFRAIQPQEALRMLAARDDIIFLDVRTPEERSYGAIPGSKLVSIYALMKGEVSLPKDKAIMLVCAVGGRSYVAGQFLSRQGYREVYNLSGGIRAWYKAGLPIAHDDVTAAGR